MCCSQVSKHGHFVLVGKMAIFGNPRMRLNSLTLYNNAALLRRGMKGALLEMQWCQRQGWSDRLPQNSSPHQVRCQMTRFLTTSCRIVIVTHNTNQTVLYVVPLCNYVPCSRTPECIIRRFMWLILFLTKLTLQI